MTASGRTVAAVIGGDRGAGRLLALGLADRGAAVAVLGGEPARSVADEIAQLGAPAVGVPSRLASGAEVERALAVAEAAVGPPNLVVDAWVDPAATVPRPFAQTSPDEWDAEAEEPLRRSLACFQGAHGRLRARGGALVVVLPGLAMSGAPGLTAWTTAAEGQRALVKVAARVWGTEGITVNCVAVPAGILAAAAAAESGDADGRAAGDVPQLDRPGTPPPAFGRLPDLRAEVAGVVAALAGDDWASVTGATIAVDGGVWMQP
jgi:NAD(P)-dependent dehydrogenase (short-subunit alcohol dehydrogenase family)